MASLPSLGRLLIFAVLVPAAVAVSNQLLLAGAARTDELGTFLYPWMAASTAVLSWCAGRFLWPAWLRWIIFAWGITLLDLLTFVACLTHRVEYQFGYVLVSAQISLLVLWAILGPEPWQSRLPSVAAVAPLVMVFSGSFTSGSSSARSWNVMMLVTLPVVALLCGGLRYLGFALQERFSGAANPADTVKRPSYQFGMKHMLIWLTVTGPLLLFIRGLDFEGRTAFPAALLALSVATVNLIAIWAVLGGGHWVIRLGSLLVVPLLIAKGLTFYSAYLNSQAARREYGSIAYSLSNMQDLWIEWLWLDAALLAALLLFFRASGYRLARRDT